MKKFVNTLKWTFLLTYFPVMMVLVSFKNQDLVCSGVDTSVTDSLTTSFISGSEVRRMVLRQFPDILGAPVNEIDFEAIEAAVEKHSAIKHCQVYNNAWGVLNVKVVQHEPIVRVFSGSHSFYLDAEGVQIPVSGRFSARVLVVNGRIPSDRTELIQVVRFITEDPFWNAQMEQIYIRRNGDYILVPRVGEHLILLGTAERLEEKMNHLMLLYKQLDPKKWNSYKTINLKFKNQVICSKTNDL